MRKSFKRGRMLLKCLATSITRSNCFEIKCLKSNISSVTQNEQRTFTLPKNIITDFSLARVLYDL